MRPCRLYLEVLAANEQLDCIYKSIVPYLNAESIVISSYRYIKIDSTLDTRSSDIEPLPLVWGSAIRCR